MQAHCSEDGRKGGTAAACGQGGGSWGAVRNEVERMQCDATHKEERQRYNSGNMRSGGLKHIAQRVQRAQQHEHSEYSDHSGHSKMTTVTIRETARSAMAE